MNADGDMDRLAGGKIEVPNSTIVKNSFNSQSRHGFLRGEGRAQVGREAAISFRLVIRSSSKVGAHDVAVVIAVADGGESALIERRAVVTFFERPGFSEITLDQLRINGASGSTHNEEVVPWSGVRNELGIGMKRGSGFFDLE